MIFISERANQVPLIYPISSSVRYLINDTWEDMPENILIDVTSDKSVWGVCTISEGNALIEISDEYITNPEGLFDTLTHEMLHSCKGCQDEESNNHKGEWAKRAQLLGIEVN